MTKYSGDNAWYRSEIIDAGETECVIKFIDFGNTQKCKYDQIKRVKSIYGGLPALSIQVKLDGVSAQVYNLCKFRFIKLTLGFVARCNLSDHVERSDF